MRFLLFVAGLMVGFSGVSSAQITVSGTVRDAQTGEALPGATVQLTGSAAPRATISRPDGAFSLAAVDSGRYTLTVRFIGYTTLVQPLDVRPGLAPLGLRLAAEPMDVSEVIVMGEVVPTSVRRPDIGTVALEGEYIRSRPGGLEDVGRAFQSLAGTNAANDFSAQVYVRGDAPDRNILLFDGVETLFPYRLFGLLSIFNQLAVDKIELKRGGFPVQYGDRLSAIMQVNTREGNRESWRTTSDINLTNTAAVVEGPLKQGSNTSLLLAGRRTYYDLIAGPVARSVDPETFKNLTLPSFWDIQAKLTTTPSVDQKLTFNNFVSLESANFPNNDGGRTQADAGYRWRKQIHSGGWNYILSPTTFNRVLVAVDYNRIDLYGPEDRRPQVQTDFLNFRFTNWQLIEDFVYLPSPRHEVTLGGRLKVLQSSLTIPQAASDVLSGHNPFGTTLRPAVYAQDAWKLSDRLSVTGGLRLDYSSLIRKLDLSPRASATYRLNNGWLARIAGGLYYQSPTDENTLEQLFDALPKLARRDQTELVKLAQQFIQPISLYRDRLRSERSRHLLVGLDRGFFDTPVGPLRLSVEGYLKLHDRLIYPNAYPDVEEAFNRVDDNNATDEERLARLFRPEQRFSGSRTGIDLEVEKQGEPGERFWNRFSGQMSYSFMVARDHAAPYDFDTGALKPERSFPSGNDRTHTLKLFADLRLGAKWTFGLGFQAVSGLPETPIGYEVVQGDYGSAYPREVQGALNSSRLPPYERLDIRFTKANRRWGADWNWYLEVINLSFHKNVIARDYSPEYRYEPTPQGYVDAVPTGRAQVTDLPINLPVMPNFGVQVRF